MSELLLLHPSLDASEITHCRNIAKKLDDADYFKCFQFFKNDFVNKDLERMSRALDLLHQWNTSKKPSARMAHCIRAVLKTKQDPFFLALSITETKDLLTRPEAKRRQVEPLLRQLVLHRYPERVVEVLQAITALKADLTFARVSQLLSHPKLNRLIIGLKFLDLKNLPSCYLDQCMQFVILDQETPDFTGYLIEKICNMQQMELIFNHPKLTELIEGLKSLSIANIPSYLMELCLQSVILDQEAPDLTGYLIDKLCDMHQLEILFHQQAVSKHTESDKNDSTQVMSFGHQQLVKTNVVQEHNLRARFFFRNHPKVRAKYHYLDEEGINPAYEDVHNGSCLIPTHEKRIWVLRTDLTLAIGIKNTYVSLGNTSILTKTKPQNNNVISENNRYGHPSLAIPESHPHYDGSVYYAGWLYQQPEHIEMYLWSGRFKNNLLTDQQKIELELYIVRKLQEAYGKQKIMFFDWNHTREEPDEFLAGNLLKIKSPSSIYDDIDDELINRP